MMRVTLTAAAMFVVVGPPALACTSVRIVPDLPAGVAEKDREEFLNAYYQATDAPDAKAARIYNRQEKMWREADSVVLVRITAFNRRDLQLSASEWHKQLRDDPTVLGATLEPVRWLKGQGQPTSFRVAGRGGGDCSVQAGWDYESAKLGDFFVAYFSAGPLSNNSLIDGLAPGSIVEPNVKALLSLQQ